MPINLKIRANKHLSALLKINQIAFRANRVRSIRFESLDSVEVKDTEVRIGTMIAQSRCPMHRS